MVMWLNVMSCQQRMPSPAFALFGCAENADAARHFAGKVAGMATRLVGMIVVESLGAALSRSVSTKPRRSRLGQSSIGEACAGLALLPRWSGWSQKPLRPLLVASRSPEVLHRSQRDSSPTPNPKPTKSAARLM